MTDKQGEERTELKLLPEMNTEVELCQKNVTPSFFFSSPRFILYGSVTTLVPRLMGWGSRPGSGVEDVIYISPPHPPTHPTSRHPTG